LHVIGACGLEFSELVGQLARAATERLDVIEICVLTHLSPGATLELDQDRCRGLDVSDRSPRRNDQRIDPFLLAPESGG